MAMTICGKRIQAMYPSMRNIPLLYIIRIAKWFNLVMPIVVLFYTDTGMNMQEIFILKSIYSIGIVAMEIPSGWMADVWGRRKTLILGSILGTIGFVVYSVTHSFMWFVLAEVILGVGYSFVSGADSAILYDTLKENDREKQYVKQEGRITSAGNFAEAIAGIVGGLLAAITIRTPFYFQILVAAMAIPASLQLIEPKLHRKHVILKPLEFLKAARKNLTGNRNLLTAILFSSVTGTATLTFAWFVQPWLLEINLPVEWFGVMWALLNSSVAVSSVLAYKMENLVTRKSGTLLILIALTAGFWLSGWFIAPWGIAFLFFFYLARGMATIILKNYVNEFTDSEVRATLLSVRNFLIRINFAVTGPFLGWITDKISLSWALFTAGALYMLLALISVIPWLRTK
ncbi:MAG: MFS transporter [Bacteroidota bacterium]